MADVTLEHVNKVYPGGVQAVSDFSMTIKDGEFVVLVGPSGCGKSTTLRMVAGLEEITSGTISIGARVVNDVPPKDRDVAMVFQNYALYPHMTVRENMAFGLKLRHVPPKEIEARIQEATRMLHLDGLLDRRPKALSGGQRQRVAVGRAIVRKPAVFLFDEPLSNLDATLRAQMRVELSRLHTQVGTTMIYVTHDQIEAMTMGQRIVVMKDGLALQIADPMTLYEQPATHFVAGFIGTPAMNFLPGRLKASDHALFFETDDGLFRLPVDPAQADRLQPHAGQPATLGLRPEDIGSNLAEQTPGAPRLQAVVDIVELMGFESYVHLRVGMHALVSRVDAHKRYTSGESVTPAVNAAKAHFFDTATEQRLG